MTSIAVGTRFKSGLTLFEVVVVMAVIAVVSAISFYNYMAWIPGIRLNGAVRQVMSDLIAARMTSVKENVGVAVSPAGSHSYAIAAGSEPSRTIDLLPNFPGTTLNFTTILFSSRGTTSPRTITIQNAGGTKTITVAITGRIKSN